MAELVFMAFIIVYAVLVIANKECDPRAYKLFWFGLLVSVLYASVYSFYPDVTLIFILMLTSLAILNQYFHWRAVGSGRAKATKLLVDITKATSLDRNAQKSMQKRSSRKPAKRRRR